MTPEVQPENAPRSGQPTLNGVTPLRTFALIAGFLAILVGILWLPVIQEPEQVLAFNDGNIESVLSPIFAYPQALFRIWDDQTFFGSGQAGTGISLWSLGETVLGAHNYRRWGSWLAIWLTGLSAFWTVRQLGLGLHPALIGAVFFTLCGWTTTFALNGLLNRPLTLALCLLVVGVVARNRAAGDAWLGDAVAGGLLGLAVTQTPDVGAFFALALAAWLLLSPPRTDQKIRWTRRFGGLVLVVLASLGTSWQTVSKMASTQLAGAGPAVADEPGGAWNWATQWSLPIGESWSLVVPDLHGSSTRSEDHPYWGEMGRWPEWQSSQDGPANFRLHGYAFGVVASFLALLAIASLAERDHPRRRLVAALCGAFAASLMLSWGRFFVAYRLVYALPFLDAIRSPEKWLGPATLFFGLLVAVGAERLADLLSRDRPLLQRLAAGYWLGVALLGLWLLRASSSERLQLRLRELGRDDQFAAVWQHSQSIAFTAAVVAILLGLGLSLLSRLPGPRRALATALILTLMGFELVRAADRFIELRDYRPELEASRLTQTLDEVQERGRLKLLPARHPDLNRWRLTQLVARGYPMFDPVSVSRLDAGYRALFEALGNRTVDLWRLGGVRWFLTTKEIGAQLQSQSGAFVRRARFTVEEWQAPAGEATTGGATIDLLEMQDALEPRRLVTSWSTLGDDQAGDAQALELLANPQHPYSRLTILQGTGAPLDQPAPTVAGGSVRLLSRTSTRATMQVSSPTDAVLVRASRFDDRWVVRVDGERQPLLRADYLFQAAAVPAGEHRIEFSFEPSTSGTWIALLGRLLLAAGALAWWRKASDKSRWLA